MSVLVVCNDPRRDPGIALVEAALARRNIGLEFLRADLFPVEVALTVLLNGESRPSRWLDGIQSIWLRHADPGACLPTDLRADVATAVSEQATNALSTLLAEAHVPVFDHPDTLALAPIKPRQLAIARSVGLRAPRTILTNDTAALRAFALECPSGVVAKMIESVRVHAVVDGAEVGGLTRVVTDDDLHDAASLAMCPMIFQERIRKVRDWRVTVVADRVFPAVVRAGDVLDWRSEPSLIDGFEAACLPADVERKLLAYCRRVGVQFAAFDLVEDGDGALWFIEANTTAYFHFIEQATGQPISDAIAALLAGELEPRR
jgi:glutathione synthase/RimK-type ligase-like ATP-grasp enzyme